MLGQQGRAEGAAQRRRIKEWAVQALSLPSTVTVMVTELACAEPGCPPVETLIAVFREGSAVQQYKIHRAAAEVNREDVLALASGSDGALCAIGAASGRGAASNVG